MGFFDSLLKLFTGGNARHYHDLLGLTPEEDFEACFGCTLWREPSAAVNAQAAALAVVGLFTGGTVKVTGLQAMVGITTTGRLVVGLLEGGDTEPMAFDSGSGYRLQDTGEHTEEKVMGPTGRREPGCILSLSGPEGELFQVFMAESQARDFTAWS